MNLYDVQRRLSKRGYGLESCIFGGEGVVLHKWTNIKDASDSLWFLYLRNGSVTAFKQISEDDALGRGPGMFECAACADWFLPGDLVESAEHGSKLCRPCLKRDKEDW